MVTSYPASIDGYSNIRVLRDLIDEIIAKDFNDARSAILAIEQTLGINPQGVHGSVSSRLQDSYQDIVSHASGNIPRHVDNQIDSPLRSGSPYSLSIGTIATQLTSLLSSLNASTKYGGSGTTTLADGYSFPLAYITSTITQIIKQLGSAGGTDKIQGDAKSGTPNSLSSTTLKSQLESLLTYINNYNLSTGAGLVGATGFSTNNSNYTFSATTVQDQIEEVGSFIDENATFLERAFDSFVVEGLEVSDGGGLPTELTIDITDGWLASNGRLLKLDAQTNLAVNASVVAGTYYVYATISNGTINVSSVSSADLNTILNSNNPVVLLHKITHNGTTWSSNLDIRRFGSLINNKNFLTVGSSTDGYGCDFISLKGAVEYLRALKSSTSMISPNRLLLVNSIDITSSNEMSIDLTDMDGLEIDGAGNTITCSVDSNLFLIESDNIKIKNLVIDSTISSSPTNASLAQIAFSGNISNLVIENCIIKRTDGLKYLFPYFIKIGNSGGTTYLTDAIISKNNAEISKSGILFNKTLATSAVLLNNSIISENKFYQNTHSYSIESCIRVGSWCKVTNNYIDGGFTNGITIDHGNGTEIKGNIIKGFQTIVLMGTGISVYHSSTGTNIGAIISDNTIIGVNDYGIDSSAGSGSVNWIIIKNNIIDNYYTTSPPPLTMVGIHGCGVGSYVSGNKITAPGYYGIENCYYISDNEIYGHASITGSVGISSNILNGIVCNNNIFNIDYNGIEISNSQQICSLNNIYTPGNDGIKINSIVNSNIVNNSIYNAGRYSINVSTGASRCNISGNYSKSSGSHAFYIGAGIVTYLNINGNYIDSPSGDGIRVIYGTNFSVLNNYIYNIGGRQGIFFESGIGQLICGNYIYNITGSQPNYGIRSYSSGHKTNINNNYIEICSFGIVYLSDDLIVSGNFIKNYAIEAIVLASDDSIIIGNKCVEPNSGSSNVYGIDVGGGSYPLIVGNQAEGKGTGEAFYLGTKSIVIANKSLGGATPSGFVSAVEDVTHCQHGL